MHSKPSVEFIGAETGETRKLHTQKTRDKCWFLTHTNWTLNPL